MFHFCQARLAPLSLVEGSGVATAEATPAAYSFGVRLQKLAYSFGRSCGKGATHGETLVFALVARQLLWLVCWLSLASEGQASVKVPPTSTRLILTWWP